MKKNVHLFSLVLLLFTYLVVPVTGIAQTQETINPSSSQSTVQMPSISDEQTKEQATEEVVKASDESQFTPQTTEMDKGSQLNFNEVQPRAPSVKAIGDNKDSIGSSQDWGDQFITHAELQDENGVPQTNFGLYDNMQALWDYSIPAGTAIKAGDTMTVNVPDVLTLQTDVTFDIKDAAGNVIGHAVADHNTGEVTITFTDYAEQAAPNGITGSFNIWVTWDVTQVEEDTTVPVDWGNSGTTEVVVDPGTGPDPDETLYKWGWYDVNDPSIIHWRVRINFSKQNIDNAKYTDFIGANQKLISGSVEAYQVNYDESGNNFDITYSYPSSATIESGVTGFTTTLGNITGTVVIDYSTQTTDNGGSSKYENSGELTGDNITTQTVDVYTPDNGGNGNGETTVSISGTKTWIDNDNAAGIRPKQIIVDLYQNDIKIDSRAVTENDNWNYSFTKLPKYDENNKEYKYTVKEEAVDNYISTQDGNNFINTISGDTIIQGQKTWDDSNNQDGLRPDSINVNLLANGKVVATKKVTTEDNWKYSFTNLPKYEDGKEIVYTITEDSVPSYTTEINGFDITNHYTPEQTSVTVTKNWDDSNNQDGLRPGSIQVQLYANDEKMGDPINLSKDSKWTYTWKGLSKKVEGKDIVYAVKEITKVKGYETTVDDSNKGNIIITNKHNVTPKPDNNKPSHKEDTPKTEPSSSTYDALPETGENERMTVMSIGTGLILLIVALIASIFRFKRIRNNK